MDVGGKVYAGNLSCEEGKGFYSQFEWEDV